MAGDSAAPHLDAEMTPNCLPGLGPDSPRADIGLIRQVATLAIRRAEAHPDPAVIMLISPTGGLSADSWLLPRPLVKRSALIVLMTAEEIRKPIPDVATHGALHCQPACWRMTGEAPSTV